MSKPNKYYQHISQEPTDGDPTSRAYKRRKLHESWQDYLAQDGQFNLLRQNRRLLWKVTWDDFNINDNLKEEVTG